MLENMYSREYYTYLKSNTFFRHEIERISCIFFSALYENHFFSLPDLKIMMTTMDLRAYQAQKSIFL